VTFTHCANPLQILERARFGRGDLIPVKTKHDHSTQQEISGVRTTVRHLAKFSNRHAQIASHSLDSGLSAAFQFREAGVCLSPIPPPLPDPIEHRPGLHAGMQIGHLLFLFY
jgi:hypothetical protein